MSTPSTQFRNNDLAAHAVYRYIKALQPPVDCLTLRPWNPYQPSHTEWYLVPSTEWPAYRFGKLSIHWANRGEQMSLGFYIERGLGSQLAGMVKSSQVMNATWYWPRFCKEVQAGALDPAVQKVLERSGLPVRVYLSLYHFNHVPDVDTGEQHPDDHLAFTISDAGLAFDRLLGAQNELSSLKEAANLRDLAARIERAPNLAWNWINLWVSVQVGYSQDDTGEWGAAQLWHNALELWLPWVG